MHAAGTGGSYQLGTGNTEDQAVPTLFNDGGSQTYRSVACGDSHTCALRADGQMVCFGDNTYGGCGAGTTGNYVQTPTVVAGGIVFKRIAAGGYHTCGLRASDGRAMCFGSWDGHVAAMRGGCAAVCSVPLQCLN